MPHKLAKSQNRNRYRHCFDAENPRNPRKFPNIPKSLIILGKILAQSSILLVKKCTVLLVVTNLGSISA